MPDLVRTALVIGGGIGGLATALALRHVDIEAQVYERAEAFGEVGAGISLWPNATRVLRRLGVLDRLEGGPIAALNVRAPSGRVLLRARTDRHDAPSLCVSRPGLIDALRAEIPEAALHLGRALASFDDRGDRVVARFADGTEAEADVLVGADGIRSAVRARLFGDEAPVYRGYPVWRGLAPLPASFVRGEISETWGDGRRFGLLDVGNGRAYWYATALGPEGETEPSADARKAGLLDAFRTWHAPIPEVLAATPPEAIHRGDTTDRPPRRPWHRGRVVLTGDAIHSTTPNLGQGGCQAIESASALARHLGAAPPEAAFAAFEAERYARTARVTRESLATGWLGGLGGALGSARNALTAATPRRLYERNLDRLFRHVA
ncbi:MAG: FAD-dependent monooxygenase [Bacteroidota bacterium]